MVVPERLQKDDDERHQRLHQAELQRGLLAEPQKPDRVRLAGEAARAVQAGRLDRLATDLRHDVALAAEVLVAQRQEVVDHERCNEQLVGDFKTVLAGSPAVAVEITLVAVPHGEEVHVDAFRVEEQQADPRVGGVDGHDEQYPDDPPLLLGVGVPSQVLVDLQRNRETYKTVGLA